MLKKNIYTHEILIFKILLPIIVVILNNNKHIEDISILINKIDLNIFVGTLK